MSAPPLLAVEGLRKAYPGVVANDDVGFSVGRGEVHALLGEHLASHGYVSGVVRYGEVGVTAVAGRSGHCLGNKMNFPGTRAFC